MGNHGTSAAEWMVRKDYLGGVLSAYAQRRLTIRKLSGPASTFPVHARPVPPHRVHSHNLHADGLHTHWPHVSRGLHRQDNRDIRRASSQDSREYHRPYRVPPHDGYPGGRAGPPRLPPCWHIPDESPVCLLPLIQP